MPQETDYGKLYDRIERIIELECIITELRKDNAGLEDYHLLTNNREYNLLIDNLKILSASELIEYHKYVVNEKLEKKQKFLRDEIEDDVKNELKLAIRKRFEYGNVFNLGFDPNDNLERTVDKIKDFLEKEAQEIKTEELDSEEETNREIVRVIKENLHSIKTATLDILRKYCSPDAYSQLASDIVQVYTKKETELSQNNLVSQL